jgi:hypothetical protein
MEVLKWQFRRARVAFSGKPLARCCEEEEFSLDLRVGLLGSNSCRSDSRGRNSDAPTSLVPEKQERVCQENALRTYP